MDMEIPEITAEVDQRLSEAVAAHEWLITATDGRAVNPAGLDPEEILAGLAALLGSLVDCVKLLATEMDRQNASR